MRAEANLVSVSWKPPDGMSQESLLTVEGTTDVTRVAEWLNDLGMKFDAIITSPLKRAQQSASIVSKIFNIENNLMNWEELQPGRNRIEFYRVNNGFVP